MGIRIDALDAAVSAQADHELPAMRDGQTVKLTAAQLATFIIAIITDSAPATLDTLNELAAALGDDPNFATTVSNALATKAPLSSPALTGTPSAPTASPGTNTTQIATTAFVVANAGALTKGYESPEQVITSAGALTLPHGMGVEPKIMQAVLVCKTAELGYSINDKVFINAHQQAPGDVLQQGVAVVPDETNLNVRYGLAAAAFRILIKNTGGASNITNGNWRLIIRAWA